jgi:hypothetical protein
MAIMLMEDKVHISREKIRRILHEDWGKRERDLNKVISTRFNGRAKASFISVRPNNGFLILPLLERSLG